MNTSTSIIGLAAACVAGITGYAVVSGSGHDDPPHFAPASAHLVPASPHTAIPMHHDPLASQSYLNSTDRDPVSSYQPEPKSTTPMNDDAASVPVRTISRASFDVTPFSPERVAELASKLDAETYRITQKAGTEAAFCGTLLDNKKEGMYTCVVCGLPLFESSSKFLSGTGWPSFNREYDPAHVSRLVDNSLGMTRIEINCARCSAHLGHLFNDGPAPTGERHCLNSASLVFYENGAELPEASKPIKTETAYFAGGCFWGIEHYFQKGPGVINAVSGYMQGKAKNPTYEDISAKGSGHAESVKVVFDPTQITYERLLKAFFDMHDPTQLNYQGPDYGAQYRSGVWTVNEKQQKQAEAFIETLRSSGKHRDKIVTEVEKAKEFYPAEQYHQDYIANTGRACHVTNPW